MKKNNCFIVSLFHCLLAIVFVSLLISHFSLPVQAALLDPCTSSPQCGADWLYCNNGRCAPLNPRIYSDSSLEKFQTIVKKSEEKGETNLQWYMGSNNGTIESTTNALTGLIVGNDIDWDALRAGNFQNARIAGAYGFTSNLVAQVLTKPPVSSQEYFADLGRNFGIVKPAYAQGIGFKGLSNLLPLWKAIRNLAYILFIVVFLATGLAIMFRVKLDPKTVVTIQNAIPKLIIALILVTFSYAIVGLLIDFIYLIIYLGVLALQGPIEASGSSVVYQQGYFTSLNFLEGVGLVFRGGLQSLFATVGGTAGTGIILSLVGIIGALVSLPLIGAVIAALPVLIFALIALFLVIKLLFALILCYISVIISVIVAPLQIMAGALPGSSTGFSSWFKNLLANILVFPAVALFLLIGSLLVGALPGSSRAVAFGPSWVPPVLGTSGGSLTVFIGFGMLMLVNKIPEMIKAAFKMKPAGYGTAIGEAFGPVRGIGKVVLGGGVERGYSHLTGGKYGRGLFQTGTVGRGVLDVVKTGVDKQMKKW